MTRESQLCAVVSDCFLHCIRLFSFMCLLWWMVWVLSGHMPFMCL